jgi:chromosome segregation ATPase
VSAFAPLLHELFRYSLHRLIRCCTQLTPLPESIANLQRQIDSTKTELANSKADLELRIEELKHLQAKKAALEKNWNDLAVTTPANP